MSHSAQLHQVVRFLEAFASNWICIDGGWGVDALLGEQSRSHSDLDLIIRSQEAATVFRALIELGFALHREREGTVYVNEGFHVDLHVVKFDENGVGHFDLPNEKTWPFPPEAFQGRGNIGTIEVRCLSVDAQVQCHFQGYELTSKDRADMINLQKKYGCVLPLSFYLGGEG
jgi:lincosamide nucleotidyltransferase A/C/D/E